jgi:hypothetical protein
MELKGKIVKILDPYHIVINLGIKDGIKEDMKFIVYEEGDEIIDPETKNSLGKLENVKAKVKISHVQELMSTAETYHFKTVRNKGIYDNFITPLAILAGGGESSIQEPLPLKDTESMKSSSQKNKYVIEGDLVRKIDE